MLYAGQGWGKSNFVANLQYISSVQIESPYEWGFLWLSVSNITETREEAFAGTMPVCT